MDVIVREAGEDRLAGCIYRHCAVLAAEIRCATNGSDSIVLNQDVRSILSASLYIDYGAAT